KTETLVQAGDKAVLRGRNIAANDSRAPGLTRPLHHFLKDEFFHSATEHSATHHPGIYDHIGADTAENQHRNQAIVPEAVRQPETEGLCVVIALDLGEVGFTVANRRQIELIAALDQL